MAEMLKLMSSSSNTNTSKKNNTRIQLSMNAATLNARLAQNGQPFVTITAFVGSALNQSHLKLLFKNKFEDGYAAILLDLCNRYEEKHGFKIVCTFKEHPNSVYLLSSEDGVAQKAAEWNIWTGPEIMAVVNRIYKQIITEFAKWQKENAKQIEEDDDLAIEYATQLKKIIVNPATNNNFGTTLLKKISKSIKSDLCDD